MEEAPAFMRNGVVIDECTGACKFSGDNYVRCIGVNRLDKMPSSVSETQGLPVSFHANIPASPASFFQK
jgi:hypothetical protein